MGNGNQSSKIVGPCTLCDGARKHNFHVELHQITGHTGEHLLRPTANYMRIKLTG